MSRQSPFRSPLAKLLSALLLLFPTLGCSGESAAPAASPSDVRVELDAFSGQPNPSWTLTGDEAANLAALLATLQPGEVPPAPAQSLGFRGFSLENDGGEGGIPERAYLRSDSVWLVGQAPEHAYPHAGAVATLLLESARRHGHGDVIGR